MSHNHNHSDDLDLSILEQMGYEDRDLNIASTPKVGFYFFVFTAFAIAAAYGVIKIMQPSMVARPEDPSFRAMPPKDYPLLQSNATAQRDMIELKAREKERLEGYGWNETSRTTAHIPVDRAMELVLEEGLPVKAGARKMEEHKPDPVMAEPTPESQAGAGEMHSDPMHEPQTEAAPADEPARNYPPRGDVPIVPGVPGGGGH